MLNFKRILLALAISCSMGVFSTYSTVAVAGDMRKNKDVVVDVVKALEAAKASVIAEESKDVILGHIQTARQFSKEINVGSLGAIVDRGADAIITSRREVKSLDKDASIAALDDAIALYKEMGQKTL